MGFYKINKDSSANLPKINTGEVVLYYDATKERYIQVDDAGVVTDIAKPLNSVWQESVLDIVQDSVGLTASPGDRFIIAVGGLNDFSGKDGKIAIRGTSTWKFITPVHTTECYVEASVDRYRYNSTSGLWVALNL